MNFEAANITFVAGKKKKIVAKTPFCSLNINFCNGNKYENAQYSFWALKKTAGEEIIQYCNSQKWLGAS